jgi:hypothetical protein
VVALTLFVVGAVEYVLAAWWTQSVVSRRAFATAAVTFVNVLLWGFVITRLEPDQPLLLVAHGLGCAVGAAAACGLPEPRTRATELHAARRARAYRPRPRPRRPVVSRPIEADAVTGAADAP